MRTRDAAAPVLAALVVTLVAGGCSSSGAPSPSTSSAGPTSSSVNLTPSTSTSMVAPNSSTVVPPLSSSNAEQDYGDARPAVVAFQNYTTAVAKAWADPKKADTAAIQKYSNGQAALAQVNALAQARDQGVAYRGTRPTSRLTVVSKDLKGSVPKVVLRDCALDDPSDPYELYIVKTGQPVVQPIPKIKPPYAKTITVLRISGRWLVAALQTNSSETCSP